jgi:pimeloyl-ACP methyl ester carboxylesterase
MQAQVMEEARDRAASSPQGAVVDRQIRLDDVLCEPTVDVSAWLRERFGRATAAATYADFQALDAFDVLGRLYEISQPTLVIAGEEDRWTPPKFQRYLAEHLPSARLVMLPRTAHYPFVEQKARFNAELEALLTEIERAV